MIFTLILALSLGGPTDEILAVSRRLLTPAVDIKTGEKLYWEEREETFYGDRPGLWNFIYKDNSGRIIARREVDFGNDQIRPNYWLEDLRDGYYESALVRGDSITVSLRKTKKDPMKNRTMHVPEPAVVDGGFHFFVEKNWEKLKQGKKLVFHFVSPVKLDHFRFRIYQHHEMVYRGRRSMLIKIDIDNLFLRIFLDPIQLVYDLETKEMLMYEGISNINNDLGKAHKVRMAFDPF